MPKPWEISVWAGEDNWHEPHDPVFQGGRGKQGPVPARVVEALDLDFDDAGRALRRSRLGLAVALPGCVGGWSVGGRHFVQSGGILYELVAGAPVRRLSGLGRRVALADFWGSVFVTDGVHHWELQATSVRPWGMPVPTLAVSVAPSGGELAAGRYLISASFADAADNEGGVSDLASLIVPANGAIRVDITVPGPAVAAVNLYLSGPDQRETSFVAQVPIAAMPHTLNRCDVSDADPPKTEGMQGPPADLQGLCAFRGFLIGWRDNVVFHFEAAEPHLWHPDSIMQFPGEVRACAGLAGGLWVGTAAGLYWVTGEDPRGWVPVKKSSAPVAPGCGLVQGGLLEPLAEGGIEQVALFGTEKGLVAGTGGGSAMALTDRRYRFPAQRRLSAALAERGSLRQLALAVV